MGNPVIRRDSQTTLIFFDDGTVMGISNKNYDLLAAYFKMGHTYTPDHDCDDVYDEEDIYDRIDG